MTRKQESEPLASEGESENNWIVSYADMMTLLMAFFALMFSFSKVDPAALDRVRQSVAKQMGTVVVMPFQDMADKLQGIIQSTNLAGKVTLQQTSNSIWVIFQGSALFEEGTIDLLPASKDTVSEILDVLKEQAIHFPIIVEGHTDDKPISSDQYASNWELSSARADLIVRMLVAKGFPPANLQSRGFADTRPLAPNRDAKGEPIPANQAMNRRITIKILRELSSD